MIHLLVTLLHAHLNQSVRIKLEKYSAPSVVAVAFDSSLMSSVRLGPRLVARIIYVAAKLSTGQWQLILGEDIFSQ